MKPLTNKTCLRFAVKQPTFAEPLNLCSTKQISILIVKLELIKPIEPEIIAEAILRGPPRRFAKSTLKRHYPREKQLRFARQIFTLQKAAFNDSITANLFGAPGRTFVGGKADSAREKRGGRSIYRAVEYPSALGI